MKKWMLVLLLFTSIGCVKKVAVHPNAISNLDSYTYDLLLVEQDSINQAKLEYNQGQLTGPTAKTALNAAIDQFNTTNDLWQLYHANGSGQSALQSSLDALVTLVGDLVKLMPTKSVVQPAVKTTGGLYVHIPRVA